MWLRGKFFKSTGVVWYNYKIFQQICGTCGKNPIEWATRSWISPTKGIQVQHAIRPVRDYAWGSQITLQCQNLADLSHCIHCIFTRRDGFWSMARLCHLFAGVVLRYCPCWELSILHPPIYSSPRGWTAGALCKFSSRVSLMEFFCVQALNRTHKRTSSMDLHKDQKKIWISFYAKLMQSLCKAYACLWDVGERVEGSSLRGTFHVNWSFRGKATEAWPRDPCGEKCRNT